MIDLIDLRERLRVELFDRVMPFWLEHAVDSRGGLNTCIDDTGNVLNRDKWLWSQWRAVWVFSSLYLSFGRDDKWLELARSIFRFSCDHGWIEDDAGWALCLDGDGRMIRGYESVYVDGFAIYGLAQLARATGDGEPLTWARKTADALLEKLDGPHHQLPAFPYPIPRGVRVHGIPMIFSLALWELGQAADEPRYLRAAERLSAEIFNDFLDTDRGLVLERVGDDGQPLSAPDGTAVVPGHVIEDMWFQIHIARDRDDDATTARACDLIRRHLEIGWDPEYGGLLLAVDADGRDDVAWGHADTKLWWPQTEALYAALLAYEHTAEPWCLEWYQKVHDYSFAHYPVRPEGEWRQKLDRAGRPITDTVALPVKDPFHLPRALIYSIEALDRINGKARHRE